jgi:hypothetical protein
MTLESPGSKPVSNKPLYLAVPQNPLVESGTNEKAYLTGLLETSR